MGDNITKADIRNLVESLAALRRNWNEGDLGEIDTGLALVVFGSGAGFVASATKTPREWVLGPVHGKFTTPDHAAMLLWNVPDATPPGPALWGIKVKETTSPDYKEKWWSTQDDLVRHNPNRALAEAQAEVLNLVGGIHTYRAVELK